MQGMHPIDERFREALAYATAEPPPELGAAILGQVRSRRRKALIWRWRALALLLGLGSAAGTYWLLHGPETLPESRRVATQHEAPAPPAKLDVVQDSKPPRTAPSAQSESTGQQQGREPAAMGRNAEEQPRAGDERPDEQRPSRRQRDNEAAPMRTTDSGHSAEQGPQASSPARQGVDEPRDPSHPNLPATAIPSVPSNTSATLVPFDSGTKEASRAERISIQRLATLMAAPGPAESEPFRSTRDWSPGRRGAWWVGLSITGQQARYRWQSDADNLKRALEGTGRWQSGISLGMHAGRSWPSGWSVGAGLEADRQNQAYRYLDRRTEERTETVTQLVTLNTQVFVSAVDTIRSQVVREASSEGAESRTRIRVPLEVAWHLGVGRWRIGPRVAAVGERAFVRSTSSLDIEPATGLVRSRALATDELEARYPLSISGLFALDLGYCASDRMRLILSPFTSRHIKAIGPASTVQASPERLGVRLLLQQRF